MLHHFVISLQVNRDGWNLASASTRAERLDAGGSCSEARRVPDVLLNARKRSPPCVGPPRAEAPAEIRRASHRPSEKRALGRSATHRGIGGSRVPWVYPL